MPQSRIQTERPAHLRVVAPVAAEELPSDEAIIDAVERGNIDIAAALYDRLGVTVAATLVRVLGGRDVEHDDLVQMAFEQIFVSLARRRFSRACSLKSWAISITTNIALNMLRKRRTERRYVDDRVESRQLEIVARVGDPERAAQMAVLREELARLPEVTSEVVVLFEVMGCELSEIAAVTGLSVPAAQSRLVRGRAELRQRLAARQERGRK